jgi:hypothetical protein
MMQAIHQKKRVDGGSIFGINSCWYILSTWIVCMTGTRSQTGTLGSCTIMTDVDDDLSKQRRKRSVVQRQSLPLTHIRRKKNLKPHRMIQPWWVQNHQIQPVVTGELDLR